MAGPRVPPRQVRLDELVTTKDTLQLAALLDEDSTFFGDLFAHVVEWRGDLYLEDGLHRALRAALQQRNVLHARVHVVAGLMRLHGGQAPRATLVVLGACCWCWSGIWGWYGRRPSRCPAEADLADVRRDRDVAKETRVFPRSRSGQRLQRRRPGGPGRDHAWNSSRTPGSTQGNAGNAPRNAQVARP